MKSFTMTLVFCLFLLSMTSHSQNAPVTIAGYVYDCKPDVTVPVRVTNFVDIGAISLTMDFNLDSVQCTGVTPNMYLPGFMADWTTIPGRLVMGWIGNSGVTFTDNTVLVSIHFTGFSCPHTKLVWMDNGISCEYAKYNNGAQDVLNDSPTGDYYKNGQIIYQEGPKTVAPSFNAVPGQVNCIPIKVTQFSNVGAISLTLDYNPAVLTFQSVDPTNIPGTWEVTAMAVTPGRLIIGGLGPGFSLADSTVLLKACFDYTCGTSYLNWWDGDGLACEYAKAGDLTPYCDSPQANFYFNGTVYNAPVANADLNTTNEDVAVSGVAAINDIPACVGGNVWSLVGTYGGAAHGTVTMTATGNYTYTPFPNYNGTDVFIYKICDATNICDTAKVTITVLPVDEPDITPSITVEPNVMHGTTNFDITIKITELNHAPTNGTITVLVPIESRWVLNGPFSNANWAYSSDPIFHIFTSNTVIPPSGVSQFVIHATWNAGSTAGHSNVTSQITSGSGGENKVDNDVDAEIIDYFIN